MIVVEGVFFYKVSDLFSVFFKIIFFLVLKCVKDLIDYLERNLMFGNENCIFFEFWEIFLYVRFLLVF